MWRHEDQFSRWYYVGEKMVLEYRIRHWSDARLPDVQNKRTVVSKQWVSKAVLVENGYEYSEYGEGSYSIPGTLTSVSLLLRGVAASTINTLATARRTKIAFVCIREDRETSATSSKHSAEQSSTKHSVEQSFTSNG